MPTRLRHLFPRLLVILAALGCTAAGGEGGGEGGGAAPLLHAGAAAEGELGAMQTRAHGLAAAEGDFVQGVLDGRGMRLVLLDKTGRRVRVLATGKRESQDFMFVAGTDGPYALEVRAPEAGRYRLDIAAVVPPAGQVAPPQTLDSPRLRALAEAMAAGGGTDAFWREMAGRGTPLVETEGVTPPLAEGEMLVTFLWRGARTSVRLFGAPSGTHDTLARLGGSDVWYRSYRLPASSRLAYKLAPDVPELNAPAGQRRRAILATARRDPFNPHSFPAAPLDAHHGESVLELPAAPPQPWVAPRSGVAAGTVETHRFASAILGNSRDVHLYRAPGYRPGGAVAVVFDAESYMSEVPTPTILDNLVAAGALPPLAAIVVGNAGGEARGRELPPNPAFVRFLAEELMPWARDRGVFAPPERTVVAGSSFGGLAAAYAGFSHPELFGKVHSQSGSFWWAPPGEEPQWLTRQLARTPALPVAFHLEAGLFETSQGQAGILETTRHLRDVLQAKGYAVQYREYASGHDTLHWRGTLATGLMALLGGVEN